MCLNVCNCTVTRAVDQISPSCVQRIASGPLTTDQFSAQSTQPFPRYGNWCARAHVNVHLTTNLNCKTLVNGSLTTYPISAQSVQPFLRQEKWSAHVRTYSCAPPFLFKEFKWKIARGHKFPVHLIPYFSQSIIVLQNFTCGYCSTTMHSPLHNFLLCTSRRKQ